MSVSFASGPLVLNQFEYNGDFRRKLQSHGGVCWETVQAVHVHLILPSCLQRLRNHVTMQTPVLPENFFTILWDLHGSAMKGDEMAQTCAFMLNFG